MKKNFVYPFLLLLIFFFIPVFLGKIEAGFFGFDKSIYSVAPGATVEVKVVIDAKSDELNGADAYIKYDSSLLSASSVEDGDFFPTVSKETGTSGTVWIAGYVDDPATSKTSSGTLATITFKGLKDGNATLGFDCDSSKIVKNDIDASNVLECSKNTGTSIKIGIGSSSTEPTTTANTQVPSTLPKSGIFDNVVKYAVPGVVLFFIGAVARLML